MSFVTVIILTKTNDDLDLKNNIIKENTEVESQAAITLQRVKVIEVYSNNEISKDLETAVKPQEPNINQHKSSDSKASTETDNEGHKDQEFINSSGTTSHNLKEDSDEEEVTVADKKEALKAYDDSFPKSQLLSTFSTSKSEQRSYNTHVKDLFPKLLTKLTAKTTCNSRIYMNSFNVTLHNLSPSKQWITLATRLQWEIAWYVVIL